MFVTIQLKNPSQQDRFSEAQQIDAGGPVQCSAFLSAREEEQGPGGRGAGGGLLRRPPGPALGYYCLSIPNTWRPSILIAPNCFSLEKCVHGHPSV